MAEKIINTDIIFYHDCVEYGIGQYDGSGYAYFSAGTNDLNNAACRDRRKLKRAMNRFTKAIRKMRLKGSKANVLLVKKRESFMDPGDSDRLEGSGVEFNIPKPRGGWFDPRRGKLF